MRIEEPNDYLSPRAHAEFPTNSIQVRPNGAAGHAQKRSSLAFVLPQHEALKNVDFAF